MTGFRLQAGAQPVSQPPTPGQSRYVDGADTVLSSNEEVDPRRT